MGKEGLKSLNGMDNSVGLIKMEQLELIPKKTEGSKVNSIMDIITYEYILTF